MESRDALLRTQVTSEIVLSGSGDRQGFNAVIRAISLADQIDGRLRRQDQGR